MPKSIEVHMLHQSSPVKVTQVVNTYQKGSLYCVMYQKGEDLVVDKFPLEHIFRIRELN